VTDTTPEITTVYLAQLDTELDQLPEDLHRDIVNGIREELEGLDGEAAAARIQQLGDPAFIAAGARAETPNQAPLVGTDAPTPGRAFSITAAVILIAGSLLIPGLGAVAGLVFVSQAKAWSRREKTTAWPTVALMSAAGVGGAHLVVLVGYLVFPAVGVTLAVRAQGRGWRA